MAKVKDNRSAATRRREQMARQAAARQNRLIKIMGGLLAVGVVALLAWLVFRETGDSAGTGTVLTGERPLATLPPEQRNSYYAAYPAMSLEAGREYVANFITEKGDIRVRLFADEAPLAVNNFIFLSQQGYFDNTSFHRVMAGFMAQGGDPTGTGQGGPGYSFVDEVDTGRVFDRGGLLAMANAGANTNGSQFFITFDPTPHLNGNHTIFGEVVAGQDVLLALTLRDPTLFPTTPGDTLVRVEIEIQ